MTTLTQYVKSVFLNVNLVCNLLIVGLVLLIVSEKLHHYVNVRMGTLRPTNQFVKNALIFVKPVTN
jgi:hypothetical protein